MPFIYSYQPQVLILRYYGRFFNSLDPAIVLVFFSSSGKNVGQNQDPSSVLDRSATAGATTRNLQVFLRVFAFSAGRLNAQNHHLIFYDRPEWKAGGGGSLSGSPVTSHHQYNRPMLEEGF